MMPRAFGLNGNVTKLYPLSHAFVNQECEPISQMLMRWRFFNANGFKGRYLDGREISYSGIKFAGSPRHVFWKGLFEPYLDNVIRKSIQWTIRECEQRGLSSSIYLDETKSLLGTLIAWVYGQMAEVDVILRGNGAPDWTTKEDVSSKIESMRRHADTLVDAYCLRGDLTVSPDGHQGKPITMMAEASSSIASQIGGSQNTIIVNNFAPDVFSSVDRLIGILNQRIRIHFRISDEEYNSLMPEVNKLRDEAGAHHRHAELSKCLLALMNTYHWILHSKGIIETREEAEKIGRELVDHHAAAMRAIDLARKG